MIPLLDLKAQYKTIQDKVNSAIQDVLDSQIFILGPKVQQFETEVARYCGVKHAIGVASGTDALLLALMALDVGLGDEVLTTPYTFFATAGSISRLGAKPVFVDIDPETYNINPKLIKSRITKKTKTIIPVHLFGQCADMDPILHVAKEFNIPVVEDAAQSIGATYKGRSAGTMGNLGTLSFFPSKNLGAFGDGGMVLTNDDQLAEKVRLLRIHGSKPKYYHQLVGVCSRLDSLQAAVLSVKLKYLDQWSEGRRLNASRYDFLFQGMRVGLPKTLEGNTHIYNQYIVRVAQRDSLKKFLDERQIGNEIYYPLPLHLQKCYAHLQHKPGDFPESEKAAQETIGLPIYPELTLAQQEIIVQAFKEFLKS
jgi:dTDP-4-amino-4,6-dideoxygalactose transaminase